MIFSSCVVVHNLYETGILVKNKVVWMSVTEDLRHFSGVEYADLFTVTSGLKLIRQFLATLVIYLRAIFGLSVIFSFSSWNPIQNIAAYGSQSTATVRKGADLSNLADTRTHYPVGACP